jgi:TolA-binding protein
MRIVGRAILLLVLFLTADSWFGSAKGAESQAFTVAAKYFQDGFYKDAETNFGDFIQKYPGSPQIPEAILFQAEARLKLGDYNGALSLLTARQGQAGTLADWYLLVQGQAFLARGDFVKAGANFSRLINAFPTSPRRLTAVVDAAVAQKRLSKWSNVIELLGQTNGVFQLVATTNHANSDVIRGYLLLSQAQLAQNDTQAAERSLQYLAASPLDATNNWQRQYLLCRVLLAGGRLESAMQNTTNLLILADATGQRAIQAQTIAFQGGLLERLGQQEAAVAVYQKNLSAGVPVGNQREALLKISELFLALGKISEATQVFQNFLDQFPTNDISDLALLTLGELRLRQFGAGAIEPGAITNQLVTAATNSTAATNFLDQAVGAFQSFPVRFPHSALLGKAQLDLGWCYWLGGKIPESQLAFQSAVALLPPSIDQAKAWFKLADAQFQLTNYTAAISNYSTLIKRLADLDEVRTNLAEPALYQIVRAGQRADDLANATNALAKMVTWFPNGTYTDRAIRLTEQKFAERYPQTARTLYADFARTATNSPLLPELNLAVARTYEAESKWDDAIQQYETWLATFINHPAQDRARYLLARANAAAGRETNALLLLTNFVSSFPSSDYAPLSWWWVGDYYFGAGNFLEAESSYQFIFYNTNWALLPIAFEARMMAGRAASMRQGWEAAINYFKGLASDQNCTDVLRAQGLFAYGDTLLSQASTNKLDDYKNAFSAYDLICKNYPTNALAALAWGQKAICLLQSVQVSQDFASTSNDFQQVLDSPLADAKARSAAEVGLGVTLEKLADTRVDPEKTELLNLALGHYIRVFYEGLLREGEKPDPFWSMKAGMEVGRLAERLQQREQAINVYRRLQEKIPALRLEEKIKALRSQG